MWMHLCWFYRVLHTHQCYFNIYVERNVPSCQLFSFSFLMIMSHCVLNSSFYWKKLQRSYISFGWSASFILWLLWRYFYISNFLQFIWMDIEVVFMVYILLRGCWTLRTCFCFSFLFIFVVDVWFFIISFGN